MKCRDYLELALSPLRLATRKQHPIRPITIVLLLRVQSTQYTITTQTTIPKLQHDITNRKHQEAIRTNQKANTSETLRFVCQSQLVSLSRAQQQRRYIAMSGQTEEISASRFQDSCNVVAIEN